MAHLSCSPPLACRPGLLLRSSDQSQLCKAEHIVCFRHYAGGPHSPHWTYPAGDTVRRLEKPGVVYRSFLAAWHNEAFHTNRLGLIAARLTLGMGSSSAERTGHGRHVLE